MKIFLSIYLLFVASMSFAEDAEIDESIKSDAVIVEIPDQGILDDSQSLADTLGTGVTSWCQVYSNGQGIRILAQNTSKKNRRCTISCPYKTKKGYSGTHRATGNVGAKTSKHVWSHKFVKGEKFKRNGRGTQSCK